MSSGLEKTPIDSTREDVELPDYVQTMEVTDASGKRRQLIFPKGLDLDRPKRCRTSFSTEQLQLLERNFQASQYLVGSERRRLAETLGLSETQIKVWYQNRRTKCKKQKDSALPASDMLAPQAQTPWSLPPPAPTVPVLPLVLGPCTAAVRTHHEVAAGAAIAAPRPLRPDNWPGRAVFPHYYVRPFWPLEMHQAGQMPGLPHAQYRWGMKPC